MLRKNYGMESPLVTKDLRMFIQEESPKIKEEQKLSMTLYNNMLNKMLSPQARHSPSPRNLFSNKVVVQDQGYITLKKAREIEINKKGYKMITRPKKEKAPMFTAEVLYNERKKINPVFS